jgi:class 3 adenylate cyclase
MFVGIDTSPLFIARTGIRGSNDLVWVGRSANYAAKLTSLSADYPSRITRDVYDKLHKSAKISSNGKNMWEKVTWTSMDKMTIYRSTWRWTI